MKAKILLIFLVTGAFIAFGYFLFKVSKSRTFQFFGELISRVETQEKVVAITFDDAPTPTTLETLKILEEKNIVATFYVIGKGIEEYPDIARKILESGHDLGNHSYSHQRFLLKSYDFIAEEIEKTNRLIQEAGYRGAITFRPPYGKKLLALPWYLYKHNIVSVMADVEPDTHHSGDAQAMIDYTVKNTRPGSIILLHPDCTTTCGAAREALPIIIDELHSKGYKFVTVNQLLEYRLK